MKKRRRKTVFSATFPFGTNEAPCRILGELRENKSVAAFYPYADLKNKGVKGASIRKKLNICVLYVCFCAQTGGSGFSQLTDFPETSQPRYLNTECLNGLSQQD